MLQIQSSAQTVGEALAEAGIPLVGLDYSLPAEKELLPSDGQIRVVRVTESVLLAQSSIPFESDFQASRRCPSRPDADHSTRQSGAHYAAHPYPL